MTETTLTPEAPAKLPKPRRRSTYKDPLTEDGILILCRLAESGVKNKVLAYAFQIPRETVYRLVKRDSWKIGPAAVQQQVE